MESETPRLTSIVGVARALIATVGVNDAARILVAQFDWDTAVLALAHLEGPRAGEALWQVVEALVDDRRDVR